MKLFITVIGKLEYPFIFSNTHRIYAYLITEPLNIYLNVLDVQCISGFHVE